MNQLFAHIVWTTRGRDPIITRGVAEFLGAFLPAVATQERATTSVSPRQLAAAITYVQHQSNHHPDDAIPGWPGWTPNPGASTDTQPTHQPL